MRDRSISLTDSRIKTRKKRKPKKDSKWRSFTEAAINVCISLPIAIAANAIVLPLFAESLYFTTDLQQQSMIYLQIGVIFTAISLVRMYSLRRIFNKIGPGETGYSIIIKIFKNKK